MKIFNSFARWALSIFLLIPAWTQAQEERNLGPVSRSYALTNITIVQAPGRKIEGGTVVIKDGLIKAVGKNITIPPDAIILRSDSLYVYPGFIDGLSHTGITKPKEETNRERVKDPGNPAPERAGITPEADVRTVINPSDKSIEEFRNLGFTVAQVVPYGKMLPGSACVILLGGNSTDRMVIAAKSALYSEFTAADRVYPNTVIGIMAKWRELYTQASLAKSYEVMYASNRSGLERPATDRILEAFYPVIDKRMPVAFNTQRYLEAHRALTLRNDLGFNLMLADLKEGWDLIPKIKTSGAKVFLSLDLPEEKKEEKKDEKAEPTNGSSGEKATLEKRRLEFIQKYVGQPATYAHAAVPFGFSTMTVKAKDVHANLRKMIAAGLTEDQALAALTTHPAQLLGLSDRLGSIDNGKIANLVVTDKPYFHEKAKVRYVFVDGEMYTPESAEKKTDTAPVTVAGSWTVTIEAPQGKSEERLTIKKEGTAYSGTVSGGRLPEPVTLESVSLDGKNLRYRYASAMSGQKMVVEVDAVVDAGVFKGTARIDNTGSYTVTGKKEPNR